MASRRRWVPCLLREVDGAAVERWYAGLTTAKGLSPGTAVRHFNVMHHMMEKAATIWAKDTGIDRNPADQVEVKRPDDQRERYLSTEEMPRLKKAVDEKVYRKGSRAINETFFRLLFGEGLIAVRAKLKGGKI